MHRALIVTLVACTSTVAHHGDDSDGGPGGSGSPSGSDAGAAPGGTGQLAQLDHPALVIVVGDSIAAGYNAMANNGNGGRGYARLLYDNNAAYPDWAQRNMKAIFAGVELRDLSHSGATSSDADSAVKSALGGSLPASVDGDVLVVINVGGNDFNDSITTMISAPATAQAAATVRQNLADIVTRLRMRYDQPAAGKHAVFTIDNIHDPTDHTGSVPAQFHDGFCGTLSNPGLQPFAQAAITNLDTMNAAIAAEAAAQQAVFVDLHAAFMGHGMNAAGDARWISNDCAHPTTDGHHHLREAVWAALAP